MQSIKALILVTLASFFALYSEAAGGVAELKALTGDAPYMGWGNQEQAPEYFGEALSRQYYTNPSYGYAPQSPYSNYNLRQAYYGGGYRMPYYQQPGVGGGIAPVQQQAVIAQPAVAGNGGFYQGGGNEWVKSR